MANRNIKATAKLFLDTKDAQRDAQTFVENLKDKLSSIETAADKMTVFKDVVAYIGQIDRALSLLKSKNGDAFNNMFSGLDAGLKGQLQEIFGVDIKTLGQFDVLRDKLSSLNLKTSITEIRGFATEINSLFDSVGLKMPFEDVNSIFSGRTTTAYLQQLEVELANFSNVWEEISARVSNGFNFGDGDESLKIQKNINDLQLQLAQSKQLREEFDLLSRAKTEFAETEWLDDRISIEYSVEAIKNLVKEYSAAKSAKENFEKSGNTNSLEYYKSIMKMAKYELQANDVMSNYFVDDKKARDLFKTIKFGKSDLYSAFNELTGDDTEGLFNEISQRLTNFIDTIELKIQQLTKELSLLGNDSNTGSAIVAIGDAADSAKQRIDALNEAIKNVFMRATEMEIQVGQGIIDSKETMSLFGANGNVSEAVGINGRVDTDTIVAQLVSNLKENIIMSLHNHANGNDMFSPQDLESFANLYYGQGSKINGIIADGMIKTIDFNGISQELAIKIAKSYANNVQQIVSQNSNILKYVDGHVDYTDYAKSLQTTSPEMYKEIILGVQSEINEALNKAFLQNGVEPTIKQFEHSQLPILTQQLMELQQNAQNSLTPVEKLKNLVSVMKPGVDLSQFTDVFDKFSSGAIDGTSALNKILSVEEMGPKLQQAQTALQAFLTLTNEIQDRSFSFGSSDGNVEIGQYTERLNTARDALLALGNQGLLTAEQLETVNNAYSDAKMHLDANTVGYTGYGDGYYWESYESENEKLSTENNNLRTDLVNAQKENEQLRAQLNNTLKTTKLFETDSGQLSFFDGMSEDVRRVDAEVTELNNHIRQVGTLEGQMNLFDEVDKDIIRVNQLLQQEKLTYEEILYLVQQCNKFSQQSTAAFRSGSMDLGDKLFGVTADIANKLVPTNMIGMGSDSPDKWLNLVGVSAEEAAQKLSELYNRLHMVQTTDAPLGVVEDSEKSVFAEVGQLDALLAKINDIRAAIDLKTQAFEQEYVTVDAAVDAEVASLQKLIVKLDEILTKVTTVTTSLSNIGQSSVELNVANSEEQLTSLLTSSDILQEVGQLEKLQLMVVEVKNAVLAKTKAFYDEGTIVGQSVGKEVAALMKLSDLLDSITPKINTALVGISNLNKHNISVPAVSDNTATPKVTTKSQDDQFNLDKSNQIAAIEQYRKSIEGADYVTEDLRRDLQTLEEEFANVSSPLGLQKAKEDFANIRQEVTLLKSAFETANKNYIGNNQKKLTGAFNTLTLDQQKELRPDYDAAINQLTKMKSEVLDGKHVELDAINDVASALQDKITAYQNVNKEAKKAQQTASRNAKFGTTQEINATAKYNSLINRAGAEQFSDSKVVATHVEKLNQAYARLLETKQRINSQDSRTPQEEAEFKRLTQEYNNCANALDKILTNSERLKSKGAGYYQLGTDFIDDIPGRKAALNEYLSSINGVDMATIKFSKDFNQCTYTIKNGDGTITRMTASFTDARNAIVSTAGETRKAVGVFQQWLVDLKGKFRSLSTYFTASFGFYRIWSVIRQGITYVKDIDSALTDLKKVTDETDATYNKFLKDMSKTGSVVGATVQDLTTMAAEWARLNI